MSDAPEAPAQPPRCRRFSVLDAMLLIAAGAIGLALTRPAFQFMAHDLSIIEVPALDSWQGWKTFLFGPNQLALNFSRFSNLILLNLIVWFAAAFLVIRLRKPRPTLKELICQPGFAAISAAVLSYILAFLCLLLPLPNAAGSFLVIAGAPAAWLALRITGRWRPEPGWIDGFGRVIGLLWIVSSTAHMLLMRVVV